MKLGISSWAYAWAIGLPGEPPKRPLNAFDLLAKARDLRVGVLQIADNLPLHQMDAADLTGLRRQAQSAGIEIEVGTRGSDRDHLLRYLEIAHALQARLLRIVIDTATDRPTPREIIQRLRTLLPALRQANVTLAIENHDRLNAQTLADIVQRIDSPLVGICLDTANGFGALQGPETVAKTLAPWIVNLHLKDFCVERSNQSMGFVIRGAPAGRGRLDVPWLLRMLAAAERDPNVILEQWTPPASGLRATIEREEAWAHRSIRYLRGLIPD